MKIPKNQTVPALWLETIGIFASEDMFLITHLRMATAYPEMIAGQQKRPASFFHPYNSTASQFADRIRPADSNPHRKTAIPPAHKEWLHQ